MNKRPLGQSTAFDRTISAQEQAPAQVSSTPQTARWARPAHAIAAALRTGMAAVVVAALGFLPHEMAAAQSGSASVVSSARAGGDLIVEANDAFRKRDRGRLAALRDATASAQHPLASWVAYWDATARLGELTQTDLDDFYLRWTGTYVEDRLRNDWLLELGRRRDWDNFRNDFARFRMNDDREVTCYALLADHLSGKDVTTAARNAWFAQRDADSGCALMAASTSDSIKSRLDAVFLTTRRLLPAINRALAPGGNSTPCDSRKSLAFCRAESLDVVVSSAPRPAKVSVSSPVAAVAEMNPGGTLNSRTSRVSVIRSSGTIETATGSTFTLSPAWRAT